VFLSSVGADVTEGTGPMPDSTRPNNALRGLSDVSVLILRAAYFFEKFYGTLGLNKQQGINGGPIAPDLPFPMIAAERSRTDEAVIGAAAALT
jgi:hypothetical protein